MAEEINELKQTKNPSIKSVNFLYMICMALFVIVGGIAHEIKPPTLSYGIKMLIIALTQVVFIFIPVILFIWIKKANIKHLLRLNKVSFSNILLSSAIMIFAMPIASFINYIVIFILSYFGKLHPPVYFSSENITQLIINLIVIAAIPAIFEEIFFRGIIMRGYEKIGITGAIVVSSLLFALLHRDVQTLLGTFILGLVISYIVYRTNSVFAGMVAHFTNNAIAVIFTFILVKFQGNIEKPQNIMEQMNTSEFATVLIGMLAISSIVVCIFGVIFTGLIFLLHYNTKKIDRETKLGFNIKDIDKNSILPLIISLALVLFVFTTQLL